MALASRYPDVEIPEVSVPQFVLAGAAERADRPALIDGLSGETITHGELASSVERMAAALHARGLRKGDVVAVFSPNISANIKARQHTKLDRKCIAGKPKADVSQNRWHQYHFIDCCHIRENDLDPFGRAWVGVGLRAVADCSNSALQAVAGELSQLRVNLSQLVLQLPDRTAA